jgi:hypothetical protein
VCGTTASLLLAAECPLVASSPTGTTWVPSTKCAWGHHTPQVSATLNRFPSSSCQPHCARLRFEHTVLCGGKVYVHAVEPSGGAAGSSAAGAARPDIKTLPERDAEGSGQATCIAIAGDFLFYGTSGGKMHMFNLAGVS